MLSRPTIEQILEETDFKVLCGKEYLERIVSQVLVGAMEPRDAVKYIADDCLMITPGDREDIIMTLLECFRDSDEKRLKVTGIVLSGGIIPDAAIMNQLEKAEIPVLLANHDTYDVATTVHDLTVKIRPRDKEKINAVVKLIKDNVDIDLIQKGM
jgi:BioD-like phosphotransacetylase family protein